MIDAADFVMMGVSGGIVMGTLGMILVYEIQKSLRLRKEREIQFMKTLDGIELEKYVLYKNYEELEKLK